MRKKILPLIVIALLAVGGGSFYGGIKHEQSRRARGNQTALQNFANLSPEERQARRDQFGSFDGNGRRQGGAQAGARNDQFISGEVLSKDEQSVTIKLPNGGSKIVFYSTVTEIIKTAEGTADDISIGQSITVNGETNQDESITAKNIQIRPQSDPAPKPQE
ncbi:MAG: hypothetical protein UW24_C0005G0014 [Parcubacteria group bacterium GW2011_GWA2_44_12]|nr:MAG: hypothetical protein UW24_C0005G0014 [Parcubacteria group bacterium GW2011_GWA2_44_12]